MAETVERARRRTTGCGGSGDDPYHLTPEEIQGIFLGVYTAVNVFQQ